MVEVMSTPDQPVTGLGSGWPAWLPSVIGLLWFVGLEFIIQSGDRRTVEVIGLSLAAAIMLITVVWQWRADRRRQRPPDGSLGTWLILLSSIGATIFAGALTNASSMVVRHLPAHIVALTSAILLVGWLHHQERHVIDPLRGRFAVFAMTIVVWWTIISLLSWAVFLSLSVWWVVGGGAAVALLASLVVWWDAGVATETIRRALIPTAIIGLEVMAVSWWLPTAVLVGATVATTIIIFFIQVGRHLWLHTWHPGRGRRYVLTGGLVLALVLLTARWV